MEIILWNARQRKSGIPMRRQLVKKFCVTNFLLWNMEMLNVLITIVISLSVDSSVKKVTE